MRIPRLRRQPSGADPAIARSHARTAPGPLFECSLVAMMTSGYLAAATSGALDGPTLVGSGAAIALRALVAAGWIRMRVPDAVLTAAAIAYVGFYPIDYLYLSGSFLPATLHLVFFLASVLLLRARTRRDYAFLKLIALGEILAASILTESPSFLVFLGVFLLSAIALHASEEIRQNLEAPQRVARQPERGLSLRLAALSAAVFAGVLVVGAALFLLLPRTARAAFEHLAPDRFRIPGFSNEVRLGEIGRIQQSSATVMHVRLSDSRGAAGLKFRGSALARFDGRRWYNEDGRFEKMPVEEGLVRLGGHQDRGRVGRRILSEVRLKNVSGDVLFLPGIPEFLYIDAPQVLRTDVDGYRTGAPWLRGLRYGAYSFVEEREPEAPLAAARLTRRQLARYLSVPEVDPRIGELALRLTQGMQPDAAKAAAIENHLRTSFGYTLDLPAEPEQDPVAEFLFVRRRGHCEYFASAMALMLRTIGIPSRVATGFLNGEYNPLSGWWVIRASDAHSWVEAYIDGYGWRSYDPTPYGTARGAPGVLSRLRLLADAAELFWREWVLAYDLEHQFLLASRATRSGRNLSLSWAEGAERWAAAWTRVKAAWNWRWSAAAAGAVIWLAAVVWLGPRALGWWRARQRVLRVEGGNAEASDATMLYENMLAGLRRRGIEKPPWMTPLELCGKLAPSAEAHLVREFTTAYNELRFGGRPQAAGRMVALLAALENSA